MELEDIDDSQSELDRVDSPVTRINHDTTTHVASSNEVLFGEHTLESLSNLTNEELLALNSENVVVEQIGDSRIGVITIMYINPNGTRELVYIRRCDNVRSVITPEFIRFSSQRHINTTSQWVYDNRTALEIEQMLPVDRILFENTHPQLRFIRNSDADLGVNWTEVRDENNSTVAIIDVSILTRTSVGNDGISIQSHESNTTVNSDGIHVEDNTHELIANEYNVVVVNHELTPTTDADVVIPGTTITLANIEQMDWYQRHRLTNEIRGLRFRDSQSELGSTNNEEYTEVIYSNNVIGVIDRRHLNQVSITDNNITISNPYNQLTLTDHDIQWMRDHNQSTLRGFMSNINNRLEEINMDMEWLLEHPSLTDRYVVCRGSRILVPIVDAVFYIPRAIRKASTYSLDSLREVDTVMGESNISLRPLIDWCKSTESDISLPDDNNEAISLNSCVNICKTFRDTIKGPLELLSYKIQEVEKQQSNSGTTDEFDTVDGYEYFTVKNENIRYVPTPTYNTLQIINIPDTLLNKINAITAETNIFKIVLRKNVIYDTNGKYIKEFYIYAKDNKIYCPQITHNSNGCVVEYTDGINISFDSKLEFNPYTLWMSGELSIMYLLPQDSLVAKKPTIKCDIIDAKNALKLHESDVRYFYKPSIISEDNEYYKMIFSVDNDYEIPDKLEFVFKEYCFGNTWSIQWNRDSLVEPSSRSESKINNGYWSGYNRQGHLNAKVISKWNLRPSNKVSDCYGCWVTIKKTELHDKLITNEGSGLMHSLLKNYKHEFKLEMNDGTIIDGAQWNMSCNFENHLSDGLSNSLHPGYYGTVILYISMDSTSGIRTDLVDKVYIDIYVDESSTATRLSFKPDGFHKQKDGKVYLDIIPVNDTIEMIAYDWSDSSISSSKDIELYLCKDLTDPIDEVNWDPSTNAFKYIIDQQFYDIKPNPNAATTLYTDFNITSSKIITADNITTMRSDLNVLTNNFDVVSYDVKDITSKVDVLNAEMSETKRVTQHLQEDIDETRIIADVALAFGVGSVVTQIGSAGLSFITKAGTSMLSTCAAETLNYEMTTVGVQILPAIPVGYSARTVTPQGVNAPLTDLTPLIEWCNSEYESIPEIKYDEFENNKTTATSLNTTFDICNHFRHSLKPAFKLLTDKFEELENREYISQSNLIRDDVIDVVGKYSKGVVQLEAEDDITDGIIKARLMVRKVSEFNDVDYEENIITINIVNGEISEYQGTSDFPEASINGKQITIANPHKLQVTGVSIKENTAIRRMEFTTNDIAYTCDIDALHKKIDAIHEQTQANDKSLASTLNEFPTVDEVNTALKNNMINMDNLYTKEEADEKYRSKNDLIYKDAVDVPFENVQDSSGSWEVKIKLIRGIRLVGTISNNDGFVKEFDYLFDYNGVITADGDVNVAFEIDGTTYYLTYYKSDSNGLCFYIDNGEDYFDTKLILAEKILKQDKIALKSEIPEPVDLTDYATMVDLDGYALKSDYDALKSKLDSLESRIASLVNKLTRIKYTFNVTNSNTIHYQFEKQLNEYDGTLYLTYNETRDNVTSVNEIKINISFNVNNTPKYEYQCEPNKICLNNIEFPLSSSNLMINATANYILINSSFFTSNGILAEDNTKNEIHSLL
ncbi:hypothetical protein M9Y10_003653 [Tritrichomonas musculus]|uniref:Uncharacterized protein n=1 Tax=Tritrichomonas musculus TaxID=1915356 RepID=A0ABR2JQE9_9EUKA